jgi:hypothetical protein
MKTILLRPGILCWLLAALALGASGPACGICTGSGITNCQVSAHAEASLVYPGATTVSSSVAGENNGQNFIQNTSPTPAQAAIEFTSADTPDKVMVWYDNWLKARSWQDARFNGEGRYWQRGGNEQISIDLPLYRKDLPPRVITYDYTYQLFSSRFPALNPAADPITEPVTVGAVSSRDVGITKYGGDEVTYGTPNASAIEESWSTTGWIDTVVLLAARADAEQVAPPRAAYRLRILQLPEYFNEPAYQGTDPEGNLLTQQQTFMYAEGFRLVVSGSTTLQGQPAVEFTYRRGDREVYELAIAYGPVLSTTFLRTVNNPVNGTWTAPYHVATISIVYAILPMACDAIQADCLALVPSPNAAIGA